jgi:putative oxidoreductase
MLSRWEPQLYAILRIIAGLLFASHGTQKVLGYPPGGMGMKVAVGSLPWFSGVIELVCGMLIAAGFFASIAAFIASGEMAVGYFIAHASQGFHPLVNRGELAVVYCFLWLYVAARGSGIWSIDRVRPGRTARAAR